MLGLKHRAELSDTEELVACQVCYKDLTARSIQERQVHYDNHFDHASSAPAPPGSSLPTKRPPVKQTDRSFKGWLRSKPEVENRFWYPSMPTSVPSNFSPGLIPVLQDALLKAHSRGAIQRAALCYDRTTHVAMEVWDVGWGCGYRNFLMACAALMDQRTQPTYSSLLDAPIPPGVRYLQDWIEDAWANGYDQEGAQQLKHRLSGTNKWIGTGELYVAFTSRGIPCKLVDFKAGSIQSLIDWVVLYFTPHPSDSHTTVNDALRGASPVVMTDRMPLVLQHPGHSRIIVGYEMASDGAVNLLIFDPAKRPRNQLRAAGSEQIPPPPPTTAPKSRPRRSHNQQHGAGKFFHKAHEVLHGLKHSSNGPEVIDVDMEADMPHETTRQDESDQEVVCLDQPPEAKHNDRMRGGFRAKIALKPAEVIKFFRVTPKRLGSKGKYQILFFPLTQPLTNEERWARRDLMSTKVY